MRTLNRHILTHRLTYSIGVYLSNQPDDLAVEIRRVITDAKVHTGALPCVRNLQQRYGVSQHVGHVGHRYSCIIDHFNKILMQALGEKKVEANFLSSGVYAFGSLASHRSRRIRLLSLFRSQLIGLPNRNQRHQRTLKSSQLIRGSWLVLSSEGLHALAKQFRISAIDVHAISGVLRCSAVFEQVLGRIGETSRIFKRQVFFHRAPCRGLLRNDSEHWLAKILPRR